MLNRQLIRLVVGPAALIFAIVACHGAPVGSPGYLPTSGSDVVAPQHALAPTVNPDLNLRHVIKSTCGVVLKLVLLELVDCKFVEDGYGGLFTLTNNSHGLLAISPLKGTSKTVFTIVGLLVGDGRFLIRDAKGHKLVIRAKVKL
jgi:hypothetical protein